MKKLFLFFLLIITSYASFSGVVVCGKILNATPNSIAKITYFNNNIEWIEKLADSCKVNNDGTFKLQFSWNSSKNAVLEIGEQITKLFIEPKDSLFVSVDYKNFDSTIIYSGIGAANNNFLAHSILEQFEIKPIHYNRTRNRNNYLKFIDSLQKVESVFFNKFRTNDLSGTFIKNIELNIKYRYLYFIYLFSFQKDKQTNLEIYKDEFTDSDLKFVNLSEPNFNNNDNYLEAVRIYLFHYLSLDSTQSKTTNLSKLESDKLRISRQYFHNKLKLKSNILEYFQTDLLKNNLKDVAADKQFTDSLVNDFCKYNTNPLYEILIKISIQKLQELEFGKVAPNFNLINSADKIVSLNDLKGKALYIDFWATWCSPCMAEMPNSKALAEELKIENILFVYINVNDDKGKWKTYLAKEKREGLYLFADKEQSAKLRKDYDFNGIPYYVLLDKDGKIINSNAARPSGKAKEQIMKALK